MYPVFGLLEIWDKASDIEIPFHVAVADVDPMPAVTISRSPARHATLAKLTLVALPAVVVVPFALTPILNLSPSIRRAFVHA